jgi:hypothetical protein
MRLPLRLHPESLSLAATHIDVDVVRPHAGSLVLCYFVTGKIGGLRLPPIAAPVRAEELWQHTCFEAFDVSAPAIAVKASSALFRLQASLELGQLSDLPRDARWRLGLSALIEETSGRRSYWALTHPPGKPDFHHPDCFAHEFSPA